MPKSFGKNIIIINYEGLSTYALEVEGREDPLIA